MKKVIYSLLFLFCGMFFFATGVQAEETSVTQAGDATSLATAVANGGTVQMTNDITASITVVNNTILDLNGFTLTNSTDTDTITVKSGASFTLEDTSTAQTGTVTNTSNGYAAIFNNGTTTIESGTVTRANTDDNTYYTIVNHGTMSITGGTISATGSTISSLVENGYYSYNSNGDSRTGYVPSVNSAQPTLIISGGTFKGGRYLKNDDGGDLTITGGTFTGGGEGALLNWNKTTITGGTFSAVDGKSLILNNGTGESPDLGSLTITGGTFTSDDAPIITTTTDSVSSSVVITGGTFNGDLVDYDSVANRISSFTVTGGTFTSISDEVMNAENFRYLVTEQSTTEDDSDTEEDTDSEDTTDSQETEDSSESTETSTTEDSTKQQKTEKTEAKQAASSGVQTGTDTGWMMWMIGVLAALSTMFLMKKETV